MSRWMLWCVLAAPMLAHANANDDSAKTSPPIPPPLEPATGYWLDPERPGTGFALQRRGEVLGVVLYHFDEESDFTDWHLASGVLSGPALEAPLLHFSGGSCLGCDPFVAAQAEATGLQLRLEFSSAREAMLRIDDAEPRRVVAMAFGVPYEGGLDTPDGLALPDLRGRWLLDWVGGSAGFTLLDRIPVEGGIEYRGRAFSLGVPNASMLCDAQACELWVDPLPDFAPPPTMIGRFLLGDISEESLIGVDGMSFPMRAFRIGDAGAQP